MSTTTTKKRPVSSSLRSFIRRKHVFSDETSLATQFEATG